LIRNDFQHEPNTGLARGIESIEKVLDCEIGFEDLKCIEFCQYIQNSKM